MHSYTKARIAHGSLVPINPLVFTNTPVVPAKSAYRQVQILPKSKRRIHLFCGAMARCLAPRSSRIIRLPFQR